jgi:hypothetical protein
MICTKCKIDKSTESFRKRKDTTSGYQYWCKDCERFANQNRYIKKSKQPKKEIDKDKIKLEALKRMLKYRYNLSYEDYIGMYEKQNQNCSVCEKHFQLGGYRGLYVDHCHTTGKVRGLLCSCCNNGTYIFENETLRKRMFSYLGIDNQ